MAANNVNRNSHVASLCKNHLPSSSVACVGTCEKTQGFKYLLNKGQCWQSPSATSTDASLQVKIEVPREETSWFWIRALERLYWQNRACGSSTLLKQVFRFSLEGHISIWPTFFTAWEMKNCRLIKELNCFWSVSLKKVLHIIISLDSLAPDHFYCSILLRGKTGSSINKNNLK